MSLIIKAKESPKEIEMEFNQIKTIINNTIFSDKKIPSDETYEKLDSAYASARKKYEELEDKKNLLHLEHNYFWSKTFQYLDKAPSKSMLFFIKAVSSLIARNNISAYNPTTFEKMIGAYGVASIKIGEKASSIKLELIEKDVIDFILGCLPNSKINSEKFNVVVGVITSTLMELYSVKANELKITNSNIKESETTINNIKLVLDVTEKLSSDLSYANSMAYEAAYKIRKRQAQFLIKISFLQSNEEKKNGIQEKITYITSEMVMCSNKSLKYAKKFYSSHPPSDEGSNKKMKLVIALNEIDILTAEYYSEAHSNKDIISAWNKMDEIKHKMVIDVFKEDISLSEGLLQYYDEEWTLLHIFAKIGLLKDEVSRRNDSLNQDWEKEIFQKIVESLGLIEKLFRFESITKNDHSLKIINSSFAGVFSEYFLYELCKEFFDFGTVDEKTPIEFKDMFCCIKSAKNKNDIKLNGIIDANKPDIDIHIENKCAIFLKNSHIDSDAIKKMWGELKLCRDGGITRVFYCINFIKNLQEIEKIRKFFVSVKKEFGLSIDVFDIKDLIGAMLKGLEKNGKSKITSSKFEIARVLDY